MFQICSTEVKLDLNVYFVLQDEPPTIICKPLSAQHYDVRLAGIKKLWAKFRNLVVPGDSYNTQRARVSVHMNIYLS